MNRRNRRIPTAGSGFRKSFKSPSVDAVIISILLKILFGRNPPRNSPMPTHPPKNQLVSYWSTEPPKEMHHLPVAMRGVTSDPHHHVNLPLILPKCSPINAKFGYLTLQKCPPPHIPKFPSGYKIALSDFLTGPATSI
jgi:hypothetical protein